MSQTNKCQTSGVDDVRWNLWSCWDTIPFRGCSDFNETLASCCLWVYEWYVTFPIRSNLTLKFDRTFRDVLYFIPSKCVTQKQSKNHPPMHCSKQKHWYGNQIRFTRGYNPTSLSSQITFYDIPLKISLKSPFSFYQATLDSQQQNPGVPAALFSTSRPKVSTMKVQVTEWNDVKLLLMVLKSGELTSWTW